MENAQKKIKTRKRQKITRQKIEIRDQRIAGINLPQPER